MRNAAALVGLLATFTFIGWCLKPDEQAAAPVEAPEPGLVSEASLDDLAVPLPPEAAAHGRVSRHQTAHGSSYTAMITAPQTVAELDSFYQHRLTDAHRLAYTDRQDRPIVVYTRRMPGERLNLRLETAETGSLIFVVRTVTEDQPSRQTRDPDQPQPGPNRAANSQASGR